MTLNLVKGRLWKGGAYTKPVPLGQATGTSTTCPSEIGRLGQAVLVPTGQVVFVPNLSHWDWKRSKETCPCPMDKSYTHAGGLSLSQDKPYDHDGTCPSPTCSNLSHKVGLQGRETFISVQGRSIRSGASGLPYYCTPPVTIPAVPGVLWRHNNIENKSSLPAHCARAGWNIFPRHR